jgi:hypothetical protein
VKPPKEKAGIAGLSHRMALFILVADAI